MELYQDRDAPGNSEQWRTGMQCIEPGCTEISGTAWSNLWCVTHNIERMDKITAIFTKDWGHGEETRTKSK